MKIEKRYFPIISIMGFAVIYYVIGLIVFIFQITSVLSPYSSTVPLDIVKLLILYLIPTPFWICAIYAVIKIKKGEAPAEP
ncbi:MAG: hypothetical protein ACTSRW_01210 [Candidatus Helarchaeota archaeon]